MKYLALLLLASLASANHWDVYRLGTVDNFLWKNTMPADGGALNGYTSCRSEAHFNATQYKISDLREPAPLGLAPWAPTINSLLTSRFYPGSWQGVNYKGDQRDLVVMEYRDVPPPAREWVEEQLRDEEMKLKKFLAVVGKTKDGESIDTENVENLPDGEKLLLFAPGELYNFLPLWVSHNSECEAELNDLSKYVPRLEDDAVIAWSKPVTLPDRDAGKRDVSFSVDARHVRETDEGRSARLFWERAHTMANRHHRKQVREERQGKRALTEAQRRDKDEL